MTRVLQIALDLQKMVHHTWLGVATLWSSLKIVSPSCVQLKCICYSLPLCIQYAVSKLPSNVVFLLPEIPSWFRHSELRREAYKELFRVMNTAT